jgi:ABC-type glycerol-3-phosphate transport system substrate-binding protein
VPKKAVAIYLLLALLGAVIFVYFTFPRTKDEIPRSNNQRPYPSSPGPNGIPAPENIPHPNLPNAPHGPSLHVMAWATAGETQALEAEADAFAAATGKQASLIVENDPASYRRDLQQALASDAPPDVCLIEARDFSGLVPARDLAPVTPPEGISPRSVAAFGVSGEIRAIPDEFSADMLFYNARYFDEAGIGYPDRHWTWDIMEAITRAMASLKLKNDAGQPIYPLELPADFDFWNILCTQAGHPALDLDQWHLGDSDGRDSHLRGLDLIHEFFHELAVTAPPEKMGEKPGRYFAQQRAALLIAPSELAASLPDFRYGMTLLPSDLSRASLARVNGWAVSARTTQPEAARQLAEFLSRQPVHVGWISVRQVAAAAAGDSLCYEALEQSLLPRIDLKTERLAQTLDHQIHIFATDSEGPTSESLYAEIQAEYRADLAPGSSDTAPATVIPKADSPQLRGL